MGGSARAPSGSARNASAARTIERPRSPSPARLSSSVSRPSAATSAAATASTLARIAPAIGPAGTAHCSLLDLAKYAAFHTHGHAHDTDLLKTASLVKLHTAYPDNADYAHGWLEVSRPWANPGKAYTHSGSNLQWFSVIWFAPARQFAVIALCNAAAASGANPAATATDQIAGTMIREFLP